MSGLSRISIIAGKENNVVIRRPRRGEAKTFLTLVDALADYEKLRRPSRSARARLIRDGFSRRRRFDPYLAFVGGIPAGYAIVFETYSSFLAKPTLYLEDLFVLPEYRGSGVGLKLFRHCVAEAKRRKCGRMEWCVLDWNKIALRFYDRAGAKHMKDWLFYRLAL
ncbi:MAG TPA: GNAT family N-acetyltransferase [Bacteroidota bacterium]|nr:GNAT family N-acetyltransferase [Bacteroidota bacterium]